MAFGGSAVFDLLAKTGSFVTDMGRAEKATASFSKQAKDFQTSFRASFAGNLLANAVTEAVAQIATIPAALSAIVHQTAAFQDISEAIGDSAQAIASLSTAADVSGKSIDEVAAASVKLTASLSKTDEEGKGAAAAIKALGLGFDEFKALSPVAQLDAVSKALANFKDGSEKTAIAVALFGKTGAQLLPFLRELEQQGGPRRIITQDQIEAADKFADSLALLKSTANQLRQSIVADLLPPFAALVDEANKAEHTLSLFAFAGNAVKVAFEAVIVLGANVIFVFEGVGREIGAIAAQLLALASLDLKGFNSISAAVKDDAKRARAELDRFEQRILNASQDEATRRQQKRIEDRGFDPRKQIDTAGLVTDTTKDDATKKLLDNQLKALEAVIKREESLLADRNRFLTLFNDQGLVSIRDFYDAQVAIVEAATTAQVAAIDKQLALVRAARNQAAKQGNQKDTAEQQGKIDELTVKRSRIEQEAGAKAIELAVKREEAERKFAEQLRGVTASVLELEGRLSEAAAIKFDQQNLEIVKRLSTEIASAQAQIANAKTPQESEQAQRLVDTNTAALALVGTLREAAIAQAKFAEGADLRNLNASILELRGNLGAAAAIRFDEQNFTLVERLKKSNPEALKLVEHLRAATIAQAEFNKAQADAQRITDALSIAEERISISRQVGAINDLTALNRVAKARQDAVPQLQAAVEAAQDALSKSPENPALIQNVERLRLELERLKAEADPLGDKFRTIFEDAGATGIETFINKVGKGANALKAFADSAEQQITRLVSQNLSQSLFGQGGPLGGVGSFFGSIFGGTGGAGAGAAGAAGGAAVGGASSAAAASLGAIPAAVAPTVAGLAAMTAAAQAAAAALASISGGSAAGSASEFIDFGAFFETGGAPPVGKVSVGGEAGGELFFPRTRTAAETSRALQAMVAGAQPIHGATLIGEDGPQLFRPRVPGYVVPADETARILAALPGFGGAFAGGGSPPVGMFAVGGERGEELFIPVTHGRRPPSDAESVAGKQSISVNNSFTINGPADKRTQMQIATSAGQGVQRALARGNA